MNSLFEPGRVYSVGEVAAVLHVSRVTVSRAIRRGRLTAFRVENQWRVLGDDALRYLRAEGARFTGTDYPRR